MLCFFASAVPKSRRRCSFIFFGAALVNLNSIWISTAVFTLDAHSIKRGAFNVYGR